MIQTLSAGEVRAAANATLAKSPGQIMKGALDDIFFGYFAGGDCQSCLTLGRLYPIPTHVNVNVAFKFYQKG